MSFINKKKEVKEWIINQIVLKRSGYEDYTKYEHKNETCSINTEMLIKALEDEIKTKNMHQVFIIVNCA